MTYQIAQGNNNAAGLANVSPQPACEGILYPREIVAASGVVYNDGTPFCEWRFGPEMSETDYSALLTQFGLTSARSALVTIRTVSSADRATFANYNARAVKPQARYRKGFYRDVVFVLRELVAL